MKKLAAQASPVLICREDQDNRYTEVTLYDRCARVQAVSRIEYGSVGVEKSLGSLPVVVWFVRRPGIAEIVNRLFLVRDLAIPIHGQVVEVLVANRLTSVCADDRHRPGPWFRAMELRESPWG
jgi:hypothetical protein